MGYGVGMLIYRELIRYVTGDLTPAPPPVDWVPESATWTLSVVDLYAAVARGDADVIERGRSIEGRLAAGPDDGPGLRRLHHRRADLGRRSHQDAVDLTLQVIEFLDSAWNDYFLGGIWLCALGLAALADRAEQTRLTGGDLAADLALGATLLDRTVETARRGRPRGGTLGPEGRGWMARARAEYGRLIGQDDPAAVAGRDRGVQLRHRGRATATRSPGAAGGLPARWPAAGDQAAARVEATAALAEATEMGARPLAEAIAAFGRRARLELPGTRQPIGVLTDREDEVLRLVAKGLTNRQVGERLFISAKTVSVHMSNVLAKLGVSGRAEAVAVAHQRGLIGSDANR